MLSGKKGQVSIEILAILGVVVIGSIVFGAYYISSINKNIADGSKIAGVLDGFEDQLGYETDNPNNPLSSCNKNNICEISLGEDNRNCTDCKCGDGFCLSPWEDYTSCPEDCTNPIPVFTDLQVTPVPLGESQVDTSFGIKVKVANSSYALGNVGKVDIKDSTTNFPTSNCSFVTKRDYNNTFTNLGRLNPSFLAGSIENTFDFTCKTPGTYTFSFSEITPNGLTTPALESPPVVIKKITSATVPPTPFFSVSITEPAKAGGYYATNQSINFAATTTPAITAGESDSCIWYINDFQEIPVIGLSDSCTLTNVSLSTFPLGENTISVYATRAINLNGKIIKLTSQDKIVLNIIKPIVPGVLYLSTPTNTYVGELFNIKVYGTVQTAVNPTVPRVTTAFNFTNTGCSVQSTPAPSCGSENDAGTLVNYCYYPAICGNPSYSQTGNHDLVPVTVSLSAAEPASFTTGYDLLFNSGNCNTSAAATYGTLKACALPMGGFGYNDNYWNSSYGFLKAYVDQPSGTATNTYGTLTVYVSQ